MIGEQLEPEAPTSFSDADTTPPLETADLRSNLQSFLDSEAHRSSDRGRKIGDFKWGVYAFYDYDGEPIYVGQTNEKLRTRIRRHLTNQRTDAVAMSVLDPFEVLDIEVWPLEQYENTRASDKEAKLNLNALERAITGRLIQASFFGAVLNEKDPPPGELIVDEPPAYRGRLVSPQVHRLRSHPDFRIARRALIVSRLAQRISERKVAGGLRRVMVTQAKRLEWLASRRYQALGGAASVDEAPER
jgi:hypothetical protein